MSGASVRAHVALAACMVFLPGAGSAPASGQVELAPHQAFYSMALTRLRGDEDIIGISGTLGMHLQDRCDSWELHQLYALRYHHAESAGSGTDLSYSSVERKDGSRLEFRTLVKQYGNVAMPPMETEYSGHVERSASGGRLTAQFEAPSQVAIELDQAALFPVAHTARLLEAAFEGNRVFYATLFDGSELERDAEVSAVIGRALDDARVPDALGDSDAEGERLFVGRSWPVNMAYYPPHGEGGEPEYELSLRLHENGVASSIVLHYDTLDIDMKLRKIVPLEEPDC